MPNNTRKASGGKASPTRSKSKSPPKKLSMAEQKRLNAEKRKAFKAGKSAHATVAEKKAANELEAAKAAAAENEARKNALRKAEKAAAAAAREEEAAEKAASKAARNKEYAKEQEAFKRMGVATIRSEMNRVYSAWHTDEVKMAMGQASANPVEIKRIIGEGHNRYSEGDMEGAQKQYWRACNLMQTRAECALFLDKKYARG